MTPYRLGPDGYELGSGGYTVTPQDQVTIIDSFEDQDIDEYFVNSGFASYAEFHTSPVLDGTYSISSTGGGGNSFWITSASGDGLPAYFAKGEEANFYIYMDSGASLTNIIYTFIAGDGTADNQYGLRTQWASDEFDVVKWSGGSTSSILSDQNVTYPEDAWVEINVKRDDGSTFGGSDNDIHVTIRNYDTDTELMAETTFNDSEHASNDGVGFYWPGGMDDMYRDWTHKP